MYLTNDDIQTGIYGEVLAVISRKPENITQAIKEAISEVRGYLTARYDMDTELAKMGNERNDLVYKFTRDIAIYNCFKISNPVNMPEIRVQTYKDTIRSLEGIQKERVNIDGLIRLSATTGSNYIKFGSNRKKHNQY